MTISKCEGTDCLKRDTCKRFIIEPLPRYQPFICMAVSIKIVEDCRFWIDKNS